MIWLYIFEGFIGVAVIFCLVMALIAGPFPCDIERMNRKKKKKSLLRRMTTLIDDDHFTDYYYW